jgi:hypothetical protein
MQVKRVLSRADYENDSAFERDVDQLAGALDVVGKRELMFSLMRECRGCGNDASYESTEYDVKHVRGGFQRKMVCRACNHIVPIDRNACQSIGRIVTLWNTTPLTIEARRV